MGLCPVLVRSAACLLLIAIAGPLGLCGEAGPDGKDEQSDEVRFRKLTEAAERSERAGEAAKAESAYRDAIDLKSDDPEPHRRLQDLLRRESRLLQARYEYQKKVLRRPNDALYRYLYGRLFLNPEVVDLAEREFKKAFDLKGADHLAHLGMSGVHLVRGDCAKAHASLDECLKLKPGFVHALFSRGIIFLAQENLEKAEEAFRKTIEADAGYVDAILYLGLIADKKKDLKAAQEHYVNALRIWPAHLAALLRLANIKIRTEDYEGATLLTDKALKLDPGNREARELHASCKAKMAEKGPPKPPKP